MDIKTLFVYISITGLCVMVLSIHVYWKQSRFVPGSLYWLSAILAISVSTILFALAGLMPPRLNIHIANSLLLLCPTLMSLSFRKLYGRGSFRLPLILYVLAFLIFNFSVPGSSTNERIIVFSLLFGLLWLDPAFLTLRKDNRSTDGLLGYAFLFIFVSSLLRLGGTVLYEGPLNSLLEGSYVQQAYVIVMGLELFLFLAGYTLMLNYRNLAQIQANEASLRAAIDFKSEVDHLMRHDLKTPLHAVINLPEIILSEGGITSRQKEWLGLIHESGLSMLEQIDRSLEMHKLEEGSYRTQRESIEVRKTLSTLCQTLMPLANSRDITITCRYVSSGIDPASLFLSTDPPLFKRLLGNLLKNAVEASPQNGTVDVEVSSPETDIVVAIHNDGAIPIEVRSRFFEKFNTFGKFQGTGMGAYAAKLMSEALGYGLSFTTDEQAGTTLTIRIPQSHSFDS